MARISVVLLLVALLLVGSALLWFSGPLRYYPGPSPKEIAASVNSALPIGVSKEKVLAFLDAKRIEHSDYLPSERRIYAIERNTCRALFVECSVDMVFEFNDADALRAASVKEGFTGL
jgi:hypothetical protein